ncbi:hypothetical protein EPO05_00145 [Patescibacteria group bacterium]|nr:MAG: hypothetical protein EPO05_00145 [Patescibacteria group bacterium]
MSSHAEVPSVSGGAVGADKKKSQLRREPLKKAQREVVAEAERLLRESHEAEVAGIEMLPDDDDLGVVGGSGVGVVEESLADKSATMEPSPEIVEEPVVVSEREPDSNIEEAIAKAEELERTREVDLDYAVAVIELIEVTEDYRNAKRIIVQRLKGELREKTEVMIDEINRRLQLGIGQRRKELTLAEILVMDEFKAERPNLKKLFQDAFLQSLRVEAYREEILRNQKKFRGTYDWVARNLMRRAADPKQKPLREVKINLPVGPEVFLEENSEEEFQQGKNMPPVDQAVTEAIDFFREEAKVVPSEFNS